MQQSFSVLICVFFLISCNSSDNNVVDSVQHVNAVDIIDSVPNTERDSTTDLSFPEPILKIDSKFMEKTDAEWTDSKTDKNLLAMGFKFDTKTDLLDGFTWMFSNQETGEQIEITHQDFYDGELIFIFKFITNSDLTQNLFKNSMENTNYNYSNTDKSYQKKSGSYEEKIITIDNAEITYFHGIGKELSTPIFTSDSLIIEQLSPSL